MLNMINRSLYLFKMENDAYQFRPEPVDVLNIFKRNIDDNRRSGIESSTIILVNGETPADDARFFIRGEALLCYSMLANLMRKSEPTFTKNT